MSEQNENKNQELNLNQKEEKEFENVPEDLQESKKENSACVEDKSQTDGGQEEAASEKGKESSSEEACDQNDPVECSCSFEPPYGEAQPSPKKKKLGTKGLIALVIGISLILAFGAGLLLGPLLLEGQSSYPNRTGQNAQGADVHSNFSAVVEEVAASVVEIEGSGSGVIIDERGYILTNEHVVSDFVKKEQNIIVVLFDGKTRCVAEYVGGDEKYDVAVLKIETDETLCVAKIGKSANMKVGDEVLAIGNPLATLGGTVTNGIISAMDRHIRVEHSLMTLLQTNAEINPGNSGGGLFNMAGELIGIVNAKQFASGIEGLGFAIPIDLAWEYASDIMEYGYVTGKPNIGVSFVEKNKGGVYIGSSTNAQLKEGDQILVMNERPVNKIKDMYPVLDAMKIGDVIEITVDRDGTRIDLEIEVVEYQPAG